MFLRTTALKLSQGALGRAELFLPPTLIASMYGMNFDHMPELHWTYGYGLILLLMASVCVGLFVTFRHNDWL